MTDLKPVLEPLKGNFGGYESLCDCKYRKDDQEKPILRFSIAIANTGRGPLWIILGEPQNSNGRVVAPAKQRIRRDDGEDRFEDVGFFERHVEGEGGHIHWHYSGLASLDLLNKDGQLVASSQKDGYCLADSFPYNTNLPNSSPTAYFDPSGCEQRTEVGLTIGWADHYDLGTDDQYIEIEKIPSGKYQLRFTVNKTDLIHDTTEPVIVEVNIDHENEKAWIENDKICK
jgi:Lysyl oxidase